MIVGSPRQRDGFLEQLWTNKNNNDSIYEFLRSNLLIDIE